MKRLHHTPTPWTGSPVRFEDWFARAFSDFGDLPRIFAAPGADPDRFQLAADVFEDDHHYFVRVELPGAKKEEVQVRLQDGVLHVTFQRAGADGEASVSLARAFRLPGPVAADQIEARLEDGLLLVKLPRHEEAKPRVIPID